MKRNYNMNIHSTRIEGFYGITTTVAGLTKMIRDNRKLGKDKLDIKAQIQSFYKVSDALFEEMWSRCN